MRGPGWRVVPGVLLGANFGFLSKQPALDLPPIIWAGRSVLFQITKLISGSAASHFVFQLHKLNKLVKIPPGFW